MTKAVIALGANLGSPQQQLIDALKVIDKYPDWTLLDVSSLFQSSPMGPADQPDYINAVCIIDSNLGAYDTLQALHAIEDQFGRQRIRHWGERTLDLDLILFGTESADEPNLKLPHPGLYQRQFVLLPLAEIAPEFILPTGVTARAQSQQVTNNDLVMVFSRERLLKQLA